MANPRKFSEKIALHNQKQAEETAEFEKIMREVSDATNKANGAASGSKQQPQQQQHLRISSQSLGAFRGGSLPNVNNIANSSTVDLKSVLSNLDEMQQHQQKQQQPVMRGGASDGGGGGGLFIPRERGRSLGGGSGGSLGSGGGSGGPMRSRGSASCDKGRMEALPYYTAGGPYLSPPPPADPNWRRTNSDSALHQSGGGGGGGGGGSQDSHHHHHHAMRSPGAHRRGLDGHGQYDGQMYEPTRTRHVSVSPDGRPKSCEVPRVNIYPSQQEPGIVQIPIGNNTGSLPDLTSFHFPSPLPTPIDQDDHSSSPYSNSPQGTSPSTLSPTSLPPRQTSRFCYGGSPPNESPGPPPPHHHYNPLSPTTPGVKLENSVDTTSTSSSSSYSSHQQQQQQQHHQQNHHQQQQHQHQQQFIYHSAPSPQPTSQGQGQGQPLSPQTTPPQSMNVVNSLSYRSPNRPSPRNSPGLSVDYGSTSPICSSPQSPLSPASSTSTVPPFAEHNNFIFTQAQANALEQHFQQFNMMDSPGSGNIDFISSANAISSYTQSDDNCGGGGGGGGQQELSGGGDPGYFSTSPSQQLHYNCGGGQHTTPNTPSSIPDIVLTAPMEFDGYCSYQLGPDMFADECLREGLDPIDLDGLQMLTDQEVVITDPATEDHFRLDRL
ncbi:hypothetical protein LSTR_LSTR008939 [Laodelphax striatellus]|uniref:Transducer of regulated CREB activity N-terminal domain-containing protein n=1 Tax=Laodelphax striatellus TaxID=195883 RepID=A0A482WQP0_LAOST|nr:hypothetical protein LSTR_LSTR008939 [Laodelphax striatellus]